MHKNGKEGKRKGHRGRSDNLHQVIGRSVCPNDNEIWASTWPTGIMYHCHVSEYTELFDTVCVP
jgi:hypothetical protein